MGRTKLFADWVSYSTVAEAGFNYWEPSLYFSKNDRGYIAYITRNEADKKNIVIVEKLLFPEMLVPPKTQLYSKNSKKEWFFGTIEGKSPSECNKEEVKQFHQELQGLASREHRVAGRDLENLILKNL